MPFFCQVEVALDSFRPNGEETLQKNPVKKKFHPRHEETIKKDPECKRKLAKWWAAHMKGRAPGDVSGTMVRTDTKRPFLFFSLDSRFADDKRERLPPHTASGRTKTRTAV